MSTLSASIARRSLQLGRAQALPYGLAILIPLIATGLTFGIDRAVDGDTGFGIYFIAVAIVGWRGGLRPAVVATTICSIAEAAWLPSPAGSGGLQLIRLVLFVSACLVASVLTDRLRLAQRRAGERGQLAREREERLELTLEASRTGVWDWDVRADSLTWSARFADLHGLSAGDSTSVRMIDVLATIVDEDRAAVAGAVQRSVESGNPYDVEYRVAVSLMMRGLVSPVRWFRCRRALSKVELGH